MEVRILSRFAALLALLWSTGCIYDHRVTQAILERRRRAKEAEGARIAQPHATQQRARYSGRIRFYVSDDHRRQHPQWRSALTDLVDASAAIVGPAFAIGFEASDLREWSPRCNPDQLHACLQELAALDPGEDEVWVVGVLGDTPRFSSAFETLGMAHLVSSHFVLRDVADLAERETIDRVFPTHTPQQRAKIYAHRKRHKRLAVFLHEWAHTLGGLHSLDNADLLHSAYDDRMASFGEANAYLIAVGLEARYANDENRLRDYVERVEPSRFAPGEHTQLLARLQATASKTASPSAALGPSAAPGPAAVPAPSAHDDPTLAAADQRAMQAARSEVEAGATHDAWARVSPLVERYPSSYAVQQLACALSMQVGSLSTAQTSCPRVQQLSSTPLTK